MLAVKAFLSTVSPRTWKVLGASILIGLLVWRVWAFVDGLTDKAYDQGKSDGISQERTAWTKAEAEAKRREAIAKTNADRTAAAREAEHAQTVSEERKKIDEAISQNRSPIDVMFPSSVR
jgi:hypothetical protein